MSDARQMIEAAYEGETPIEDAASAVAATIEALDKGEIRIAEPTGDAGADPAAAWHVNEWAKQAILLYFRLAGLETTEVGTTTRSRPRRVSLRPESGWCRPGPCATEPSASPA